MIEKILEKYTELKVLTADFIEKGKKDRPDFIKEVRKVVKSFSELLKEPEKKSKK